MKAKPIVTISLAVVLCGGLLLAFPTLWMFLLLVLLGLIALQASILRRNLQVIARDSAGKAFSLSAPPVTHAPPASAPQPVQDVSAVLNRELFSRFRQHLETVETVAPTAPVSTPPAPAGNTVAAAPAATPQPPTAPRAVPPPPATPAGVPSADHLATEEVADRIAISGAAKASASKVKPRPTYPPDPRPKPAPVEPEKEEDWFADLRPSVPGPSSSRKLVPPPPAASAETATQAPGQDEESATLLKLAEDSVQRNDLTAAKAAMGHYLSLMNAHGAEIPWSARRVQTLLALQDDDAPGAIEGFESMLKAGFELKEEGVPALLDQMTAGAKPELAEPLRVSMLLRVLAVFRQNKDRAAMDRLYRMLVEAQEKVGDERKLVQFLKNHLEIKKVMGDMAGQVDLIDQIGNRLFKLGETAAAREFYELGLKLRADLQQAQPAAETKPGTTTQTA